MVCPIHSSYEEDVVGVHDRDNDVKFSAKQSRRGRRRGNRRSPGRLEDWLIRHRDEL